MASEVVSAAHRNTAYDAHMLLSLTVDTGDVPCQSVLASEDVITDGATVLSVHLE